MISMELYLTCIKNRRPHLSDVSVFCVLVGSDIPEIEELIPLDATDRPYRILALGCGDDSSVNI